MKRNAEHFEAQRRGRNGWYLGADPSAWRAHDAVALIEDGARLPEILVDQGEADQFLAEQLKPSLLAATCYDAGSSVADSAWIPAFAEMSGK